MKTKKLLGLILAVCLISAVVMAEASNEKEAEQKNKKADVSASEPSDKGPEAPRRSTPVDRRQMYQEMLAKRMVMHEQALEELKAIKKIAEEENAPRTAEAIQKMIDKKNAEFQQKIKQFESQQRDRSRRVQRRPERMKPVEKAEDKVSEEK